MYHAEVMGKLPVVQHFLFGSILPYSGLPPPTSPQDDAHAGHAHTKGGWGDCCGIPIPSAFGAAADQQRLVIGKPLTGSGIRPVPFD